MQWGPGDLGFELIQEEAGSGAVYGDDIVMLKKSGLKSGYEAIR